MNRDKLIEMLMQAGFEYTSDLVSKIDKFEKLLEIEREECAKVVGQQWSSYEELKAAHYRHTPETFDPFRYYKDLSTIFFSRDMADAIRARGSDAKS